MAPGVAEAGTGAGVGGCAVSCVATKGVASVTIGATWSRAPKTRGRRLIPADARKSRSQSRMKRGFPANAERDRDGRFHLLLIAHSLQLSARPWTVNRKP